MNEKESNDIVCKHITYTQCQKKKKKVERKSIIIKIIIKNDKESYATYTNSFS